MSEQEYSRFIQDVFRFIQDIFRYNGVGSLQDIHVMLRHHKEVLIGQIQDQWLHIEIKKEPNQLMKQEEYLILSSGSNTFYRTNAHYKYKSIELVLKWTYENLCSLHEYDKIFQELGYEITYPMKYVRKGESYLIYFSLHNGRWQVCVTGRVTRFLEGKDLLSEIVEVEKEFLTLEEMPLFNNRLKELIIRSK